MTLQPLIENQKLVLYQFRLQQTLKETHKKNQDLVTHQKRIQSLKEKSETHIIYNCLGTIHHPCFWIHQNHNKPNTKNKKVLTVLYFPNQYQKGN